MYNYRRVCVSAQARIKHALNLDSPSVVGTPSVAARLLPLPSFRVSRIVRLSADR